MTTSVRLKTCTNCHLATCLALLLYLGGLVSAQEVFSSQLTLPDNYHNARVTQLSVIEPGTTATLMDVEGPGAITHLWMTLGHNDGRAIVLRMYWDGETEPSVEAPLPDFFGVGHGGLEPEEYFATPVLVVAPNNGYNAYFPMPFRKRARITVTNEQPAPIAEGGGLYFQADYVTYDALAEDVPYFHAQWRREAPAERRGIPHTVMQALGKGFIAGVTLHVRADDPTDRWFHGGGDTIYLDCATNPVVLKGIGGEDFFGESWGSKVFVSPYAGSTSERNDRISFYRFFLEGPPRFDHDAWFAFGALENEITSVAYWYQSEPHTPFTKLPPVAQRSPESRLAPGEHDVELSPEEQLDVAVIGPFAGDIAAAIPLDGMQRIEFNMSMLTNYGRPFGMTIPDETNRSVRWQSARTVLGWLDFDGIYKPKMPGIRNVQALPGAVAYAYVRIESDAARETELIVTHDDAVRLWLNGTQIDDLAGRNKFVAENVALSLVQGRNDLLLKCGNTWNTNWGAFAVGLQVTDRTGIRIVSE